MPSDSSEETPRTGLFHCTVELFRSRPVISVDGFSARTRSIASLAAWIATCRSPCAAVIRMVAM